jgi:hypothetical protein
MLFIPLHLLLHRALFPSGFPSSNLYTFLFSPIRATCPAHFIFLDTIVLIILGEDVQIMQLSPPSRHSIPLRSKYSPQLPVLKNPEVTSPGTAFFIVTAVKTSNFT